ncbi:hypothetical protein GGR67_000239 [Xanthomonas arboricola]|nr:hypothetical protein [Xanthomonas euroxanthea]MBB5766209.1 hypothetical protein [Xanthomonas euroxanthea]
MLFLLLPVHLAKRLHLARLLYWPCDGVACFHVRHQVSRVVERPLNSKRKNRVRLTLETKLAAFSSGLA